MANVRTDRPFPRKHRLERSAYADPTVTFHITIRAFPGLAPFEGGVGNAVWDAVLARRAGGRVNLWAACLMPDHLHLLASPGSAALDRWIASFKSYATSIAWTAGFEGALWQPSYHDRRVGDGAAVRAAAEYIRTNPVMAELVREPEAWPWTGAWVD